MDDYEPKDIPNRVDDVFADMRFKYRKHLGLYRPTRNAENYFDSVFRGSVAQCIVDGYLYNDAREVIHALLEMAARNSTTRAFTLHPFEKVLTTTDVWHGLVSAIWVACPLAQDDIGPEGRWCNLVEPCPPNVPDCEVEFNFRAGKSKSLPPE